MISRRQIISGQPGAGDDQQQSGGRAAAGGAASSSSSSSGASKPSASRTGSSSRQANQSAVARQQRGASAGPTKMSSTNKAASSAAVNNASKKFQQRLQQQHHQQAAKTNSADYMMSSSSNHQYEDYVDERSWRRQHQQQTGPLHNSSFNGSAQQDSANMNEPFRQHFDPYSIYSDEEDVWCSEERLFEVSRRTPARRLCVVVTCIMYFVLCSRSHCGSETTASR
jgi:hypothetical protein